MQESREVLIAKVNEVASTIEEKARSPFGASLGEVHQEASRRGLTTESITTQLQARGCTIDWERGVVRCPTR